MTYGLYAVHDAVTGFLTPTVDQSDPAAVRNFAHAVKAGQSLMSSHPSDYDLYHIGWYDTDKGLVSPIIPPEQIASATSFMEV